RVTGLLIPREVIEAPVGCNVDVGWETDTGHERNDAIIRRIEHLDRPRAEIGKKVFAHERLRKLAARRIIEDAAGDRASDTVGIGIDRIDIPAIVSVTLD